MFNDNAEDVTPTKPVEVDEFDAALLGYCVKKYLEQAKRELAAMRMFVAAEASGHFLASETSRDEIPESLKSLTTNQIEDQIDPWISLVGDLQRWQEKFETLFPKRVAT